LHEQQNNDKAPLNSNNDKAPLNAKLQKEEPKTLKISNPPIESILNDENNIQKLSTEKQSKKQFSLFSGRKPKSAQDSKQPERPKSVIEDSDKVDERQRAKSDKPNASTRPEENAQAQLAKNSSDPNRNSLVS
jgi:hypothetical protein